MSVTEAAAALSKLGKDDAVVHYFTTVWPLVEAILEAFSRATKLPIFVYLNTAKVFQSSLDTMPPFCAAMLTAPATAIQCVHDGVRRALGEEPELTKGVQLCHAGMVNGRCARQTCVGTLAVLFGAKRATNPEAHVRREAVVKRAERANPAVAALLRDAESEAADGGAIAPFDGNLMTAITEVIARLIDATVGFRVLTINMAHELSLVMLGLGLLSREMAELKPGNQQQDNSEEFLEKLERSQRHIQSEARLGLYVVRNFLSYSSQT